MFAFIKNIKKNIDEKIKQQRYVDFCLAIDKHFNNKSDQVLFNFSKEGYYRIFDKMVGEAKFQLNICLSNYDVLFERSTFLVLKMKAHQGLKINIVITNGDITEKEKFKELSSYDNVNIYVCKADVNNFILADYSMYWLEANNHRTNLNEFIHAELCFHNYKKSSELQDIFDKLIQE